MSLDDFWQITGLALGGLAFFHGVITLIALWVRRESSARGQVLPPVTVLKPLHGEEVALYEALRSFCDQDYPVFQIVYGVRDAHDPALNVVRRLQQEFPKVLMSVVVDARLHGTNYKVSNLINMMAAAKHEYLVLADSDIHVRRDYLAEVVPPLLDEKVGIVTCAYRGRPQPNMWARLGAQYIDDWFMPSIMLAHLLGGRTFAFGATIGLRREVLERIGGFMAINNHLADDYMLSYLTKKIGLSTVLSHHVVETSVRESDPAALARHELRWMRTNRFVQPLGYAFSFITFTVPLAIAGAWLAEGAAPTLLLLCGSVLARVVLHVSQRARGKRPLFSDLWLFPLRDAMIALMWASGFASRQVDWGQQKYSVARDGSFNELY
jgi:ceramide glucosyltransferase